MTTEGIEITVLLDDVEAAMVGWRLTEVMGSTAATRRADDSDPYTLPISDGYPVHLGWDWTGGTVTDGYEGGLTFEVEPGGIRFTDPVVLEGLLDHLESRDDIVGEWAPVRAKAAQSERGWWMAHRSVARKIRKALKEEGLR